MECSGVACLASRFSLLASRFSLLAAVCLLILLPLSGCKQTVPVNNGQVLQNLQSTPEKPLIVTATLPAGVDAWIVEVGGPASLSVDVLDASQRLVKSCAPTRPCWIANPPQGKYEMSFPSTQALTGLSLATAWGGPEIFTLGIGGAAAEMGGSAGMVRYHSVRVAAGDELRLNVPGAAGSDLVASFLSGSGETVQTCESAESCVLAGVPPATYFVKTMTATGTAKLMGVISYGLVDLQGVWVVRSYQIKMDWWREAMMMLLDIVERYTSPNYLYDALRALAVEQSQMFYDYGFPTAAREILLGGTIDALYAQSLLDRFIRNNPIDLAAERERISAVPDLVRVSFDSVCDSVGKGGSYMAFKYDQNAAQYLFSTGKLTSCVVPSTDVASVPYGLKTGRMVSSTWLTSFLQDDSQVDLTARSITADIIEMRVNEDPLTGTRVWFERQACETPEHQLANPLDTIGSTGPNDAAHGYYDLNKNGSNECVEYLQATIPDIGSSTTWEAGRNVLEALASGDDIAIGTAIMTADENGGYPDCGNASPCEVVRHGAIYMGPIERADGVQGFLVLDQWSGMKVGEFNEWTPRELYPDGKRTSNASLYKTIKKGVSPCE
jgi:hypothetical protein